MTWVEHFLAREGWDSTKTTKRCIHCKNDFASKSSSKARTCSKSCAAFWRESKGEARRIYRERYSSYRQIGLQ